MLNLKIKNHTAFFDSKKMQVAENPICINIIGDVCENTYAIIQNGIKRKIVHVENNQVIIPKELLYVGKVLITLERQIDGISVWNCTAEPLYLVDTETSYTAIPELEAIKETLKDHEKRLNGTSLYDFE